VKLQQPTFCQVLNPEDHCVEDEKEKQLRNVKAFFFCERRLFYILEIREERLVLWDCLKS